MRALTTKMPTPEIVLGMLPHASATGTFHPIITVNIPFNSTSTADAAMVWINRETGTVAAKVAVYWRTAGTGTYDVGVQTDGTGSNDNIINGGTMLAGVHTPGTVAATAVTGNTAEYFLLGPGGTGTNNSIVMKHNEMTSTAAGGLIVQYFLIGS